MPEHTTHRVDHSRCPSSAPPTGRRLPARLRYRRPLVVPPGPGTGAKA